MNKKIINRRIQYSESVFSFILACMGVAWGMLYSRYSSSWDIGYHTIVAEYILGNELGIDFPIILNHIVAYPLYHIIQKVVAVVFRLTYEDAAVIVLSLCNIVSVLLFRKLALLELEREHSNYFIDFVCLGIVVFMPLYSPLVDWKFYDVHGGTNLLHNPTFLFMRPMAIICVMCFLLYIRSFVLFGKIDRKLVLAFMVSNIACVFAKPSFSVVFLPSMGIIVFYILLKTKNIWFGLITFLSVVPSLCFLVWQLYFVRKNSEIMNVDVVIGGVHEFSVVSIICITMGMIPTALFLVHKTKDIGYVLGWIGYIASCIPWYFLSNGSNGDFFWGHCISMQFLVFFSLISSYKSCGDVREGARLIDITRWLGYVIFLCQCICGVCYFYKVFKYGNYLI